ncbi:MAG TPA: hypothetical protein P5018_08270 [Rectinema sp.]|nr:hypothetical protein [Rectinema sp.]
MQLGFQLSYLINNHEVVRKNSVGIHDTGLVSRVNPEGIRPATKQLLPTKLFVQWTMEIHYAPG